MHIAGDDLAGLTLALRSRLRGQDVTVHGAATAVVLDEVFALPAPYRDLMLKSGAALEDAVGLIEIETGPSIVADDGTVFVLPGVGPYAPTLRRAWGPDAAEAWTDCMRTAADVWGEIRVGRFPVLPPLAALAGDEPQVQGFLARYAADLGLSADEAYGGLIVRPYLAQTFGLWSIRGGNAALTAELRTRCEARGVQFSAEPAPATAVGSLAALDALRPLFTTAAGTPAPTPQALGLPFVAMGAEAFVLR